MNRSHGLDWASARVLAWSAVAAAGTLALASGVSRAEFRSFDDFEDEIVGPIDDQDGWSSSGGDNRVTLDPSGGLNQTLYVPSDSSVLRKSLVPDGLAIANGDARMMFLRLYVSRKQSFSLGLSPMSAPSEYSDFGPELGMANSAPNLDLRVWDDDGGNYETLRSLPADRWCNVWVFVDAGLDTCSIWLNTVPGADAGPTDRLAAADGDETFDFRAGTLTDIVTFYIKTSGGSSGENFGPIYIDDIHIETTDVLNLTNPHTPECRGDVDGDGDTDVHDFAVLASVFGASAGDADWDPNADLNGDLTVDILDFAALVAEFGCDSN